jgi:hypothetical protein
LAWTRPLAAVLFGLAHAGGALAQDPASTDAAPLPCPRPSRRTGCRIPSRGPMPMSRLRPRARNSRSCPSTRWSLMPWASCPGRSPGLPPNLWGASETEVLARLFRAQPVSGLPAALSLTEMLALAELAPPADGRAAEGELFLARLDMLLARGALDPALALMERAGPTDPRGLSPLFRCEPVDRPWRPRLPRDGGEPRHRPHLPGAHLLPRAQR